VDVDAAIETLFGPLLWPAFLGAVSAFVFLALLAQAQLRTRSLVAVYVECVRRRVEQEKLQQRLGLGPKLAQFRRLEQLLRERLRREGL
jgi:hypothetical protein